MASTDDLSINNENVTNEIVLDAGRYNRIEDDSEQTELQSDDNDLNWDVDISKESHPLKQSPGQSKSNKRKSDSNESHSGCKNKKAKSTNKKKETKSDAGADGPFLERVDGLISVLGESTKAKTKESKSKKAKENDDDLNGNKSYSKYILKVLESYNSKPEALMMLRNKIDNAIFEISMQFKSN